MPSSQRRCAESVMAALPASPRPNPRWSARGAAAWPLLLLAAAVCGAALWFSQRQGRLMRLAITSWPGYEYLYLAEQRQLGRPYGLDLRVVQATSLEDQRRAYVRADVNVIATTLPEAIAICQEAPPRCPQLLLVLDESQGADRLLARRELQGPRDLLGRRLGLENTVLAEYLLLRSFPEPTPALDQFRLHRDGPVALVQRLREGQLDAIVTYPPYDIALQGDDRFHELFSSREMPGEVVDVLAVDPTYARQRGRELRALVRTWWAARAYAQTNRAEAVALMARRQQVSPEAFEQSEQGLRFPAAAEQADLLAAEGPLAEAIARTARLMRDTGRIQPDGPLPQPTTAFLVQP